MLPPQAVSAHAIVLATLNAKYIHASLGLRYLLANMARHGGGDLRAQTVLREFTIARPAQDIVDELLALNPQIIGFGVYIWNVTQTCEVVRLLKTARPDVKVVLGGPEVSHETEQQDIVALADHVITGWGDVSFPKLCRALLHGPQPLMKVIVGEQPPLDEIVLPYAEYSDADLAHRLLYVEASRGCPFKCEFCLSSLDKTAWAFELDAFLAELDGLYRRGARNFKFVDRTFNLKIDASLRILQFFLDKLSEGQFSAGPPQGKLAPSGGSAVREATSVGAGLFVHFEVIPDHLPDRLKEMIARFPAGVLQFEVGIQSFNVEVQQRISRRQDNDKTEANLRWLVGRSQAHLHTDLIFGLPGETLESFAEGFDRLHALGPHEIQLGILKRLRGTPIARHTAEHGMVYDTEPPYTVRQTAVVDAATMQRFARLARYWDLVANSGRFPASLILLLQGTSAFGDFLRFADWLWGSTGETSGLTPERLVDALFDYLTGELSMDAAVVRQRLLADYLASGARASPRSIRDLLPVRATPVPRAARTLAERQDRHAATPAGSKIGA
ncbi:MAG: B12-binding domain-containing radical SAM protein [Gammaproteobacteria bacterium]|nr:B12-binding domain-containing radical SAM protein [Gammaproteobacteria bacterium]MBU0785992.1 B12-binding domain-containing radical SAM protein [Gammaproteobacteria bacterium]MBU0816605.1 B12-binding domain-containing radical SAM protein [Gammaproteobacteria bacterium]MBU1788406.1 B12-binding domain-containing radical SAM protein [Gammaproteobacteria bacterium]